MRAQCLTHLSPKKKVKPKYLSPVWFENLGDWTYQGEHTTVVWLYNTPSTQRNDMLLGRPSLGLVSRSCCRSNISVPIPTKSGKEINLTKCFSVSSTVKFADSLDWLHLMLVLGVKFMKISQFIWNRFASFMERVLMVCD